EDVATFASLRNVAPIITHASYLINLATTNAEFHRKSIEAMADELDRAERLGIHAVVLHPGAHLGAGVDHGVDQIARSLDRIDDKKRVGICVDTCHIFAAGYDIRTRDGWERTADEIERHVGVARVGA